MAPPNDHLGRKTREICKCRYKRQDGQKRKFMAKFPLSEDRCRQWVKVVGKEDLAYVPIKKLHSLKYVCEDHFHPKDFNRKGTRLKKWAVPSLFITSPPLADHILAEFPFRIAKSEEETAEALNLELCKSPTTGD